MIITYIDNNTGAQFFSCGIDFAKESGIAIVACNDIPCSAIYLGEYDFTLPANVTLARYINTVLAGEYMSYPDMFTAEVSKHYFS